MVASLLEPAGELRAGNALLNVAFTAGAAVGPALAGLVVAGFGLQTALFAQRRLLLPGRLDPGHRRPICRRPSRKRAARASGSAPESPTCGDNPLLRRLLVAQGAAFVFFSAVIPIEVIYAKETLGTGDTGYGVMLASWGVGMVLGSLVFARARRAPLPPARPLDPGGRGRLPRIGDGAEPGHRLRRPP